MSCPVTWRSSWQVLADSPEVTCPSNCYTIAAAAPYVALVYAGDITIFTVSSDFVPTESYKYMMPSIVQSPAIAFVKSNAHTITCGPPWVVVGTSCCDKMGMEVIDVAGQVSRAVVGRAAYHSVASSGTLLAGASWSGAYSKFGTVSVFVDEMRQGLEWVWVWTVGTDGTDVLLSPSVITFGNFGKDVIIADCQTRCILILDSMDGKISTVSRRRFHTYADAIFEVGQLWFTAYHSSAILLLWSQVDGEEGSVHFQNSVLGACPFADGLLVCTSIKGRERENLSSMQFFSTPDIRRIRSMSLLRVAWMNAVYKSAQSINKCIAIF